MRTSLRRPCSTSASMSIARFAPVGLANELALLDHFALDHVRGGKLLLLAPLDEPAGHSGAKLAQDHRRRLLLLPPGRGVGALQEVVVREPERLPVRELVPELEDVEGTLELKDLIDGRGLVLPAGAEDSLQDRDPGLSRFRLLDGEG